MMLQMNTKWQMSLQNIPSVDLLSCLLLCVWWKFYKKEMVNQLHFIFYFIYFSNNLEKRILTVQYLPYNGYYSHTEWLSTTERSLCIHYTAALSFLCICNSLLIWENTIKRTTSPYNNTLHFEIVTLPDLSLLFNFFFFSLQY